MELAADYSTAASSDNDSAESPRFLLSECWIRTKLGNHKDYQITIENGVVDFSRPKSVKTSNLSYKVDSFQCVIGHQTDEYLATEAHPFCLLIISS